MKTLFEKGGAIAALILAVGTIIWLARDPNADVTTGLEPHGQELSEMAERLREIVACQESPAAPNCTAPANLEYDHNEEELKQ